MKQSRSASGDKPDVASTPGPSGPAAAGGRAGSTAAGPATTRAAGKGEPPSYNTSPRHLATNPFPRLWTAFIGFVLLTVLALTLAVGEWKRPIVGMLVDPFGRVTNYGWPTWSGFAAGLAYPDQVLEVDGHPLRPPYGPSLEALAEKASRSGAAPVDLLVAQGSETRRVQVRCEPLGFLPWLLLCGGYLMLAWLWLFAAGLSYTVRPNGGAVGVFVRWVMLSAGLLITIFDYHTSRRLVLLNLLFYSLLPTAIFEFGLVFPERVRVLAERPRLARGLRAIDVLLFSLQMYGVWTEQSFRLVCDFLCGAAILGLTLLMSLRCAKATGRRRVQLAWGLLLLLPVYGTLGAMLLISPERSGPLVFVLAVPLTAVGALGMTYALVRYDLWDSRALLHRPGLRPLLTATLSFMGGMLCLFGFLGIRNQPLTFQLLYVLAIAAFAGPTHRFCAEWLDKKLFPAEAFYRNTVDQLSLRFTDLRSQAAVIETVEEAVRRVSQCERVRLCPIASVDAPRQDVSIDLGRFMPKVAQAMAAAMASGKVPLEQEPSLAESGSMSHLEVGALTSEHVQQRRRWRILKRAARGAGLYGLSTEQAGALSRGEMVYLSPEPMMRSSSPSLWTWLLVPARFRDQVVGLLAVSPKLGSQLFTSEDEDLLRTIANQAALALACATASEQIETLRRAQEEAFREQLGAAIGTIAAEIAHEIRFPINFFRMLVERHSKALQQGKVLSAADLDEDLDIGREEVERLERMADQLRRIAQSRGIERQALRVRSLIDHVRLLLRDRLHDRLIEVDVPSSFEVTGDRDALTQILLNLMANALDASPPPGRVGVTVNPEPDGRLRLLVWDTGAGFAVEVGKLFQPWFTTKPKGSGLGLPITHRLVRAHGWEITASRRGDRTCFDVLIAAGEWQRRDSLSLSDDAEGDDASEDAGFQS
jgi:signal transduction histidine kinase